MLSQSAQLAHFRSALFRVRLNGIGIGQSEICGGVPCHKFCAQREGKLANGGRAGLIIGWSRFKNGAMKELGRCERYAGQWALMRSKQNLLGANVSQAGANCAQQKLIEFSTWHYANQRLDANGAPAAARCQEANVMPLFFCFVLLAADECRGIPAVGAVKLREQLRTNSKTFANVGGEASTSEIQLAEPNDQSDRKDKGKNKITLGEHIRSESQTDAFFCGEASTSEIQLAEPNGQSDRKEKGKNKKPLSSESEEPFLRSTAQKSYIALKGTKEKLMDKLRIGGGDGKSADPMGTEFKGLYKEHKKAEKAMKKYLQNQPKQPISAAVANEFSRHKCASYKMHTFVAWKMSIEALDAFAGKRNDKKHYYINKPMKTVHGYSINIWSDVMLLCNDLVIKKKNIVKKFGLLHQTQDQFLALCYFANASTLVANLYNKLKAGRIKDNKYDNIIGTFTEAFNSKRDEFKFQENLTYDQMNEEMLEMVDKITLIEVQTRFTPMSKEIALALLISILNEDLISKKEKGKILVNKFGKFDAIFKIGLKCREEKYTEEYFDLCILGLITAFLDGIFEKIFEDIQNVQFKLNGREIGQIFKQMENEFEKNGEEIGWEFEKYSKTIKDSTTEMELIELIDDHENPENKHLYTKIYEQTQTNTIDLKGFVGDANRYLCL
ncbi:hypothetical protein niasHT_002945 [Heterodera trifolii]|uniref:Uncharacterized protein n=1 Tax=Heterodera trifolii TaxID=157864 RepID=A0ABD2LP22_9BILA